MWEQEERESDRAPDMGQQEYQRARGEGDPLGIPLPIFFISNA
ncbi:MAG: hypothetical protein RIE73_28935 [Coleofasciculus sp. C1-SOL-03]